MWPTRVRQAGGRAAHATTQLGGESGVARQITPDSVVAGATTFFEVQVYPYQSLILRRDCVCQRRLVRRKQEKESAPLSLEGYRGMSQRLGWYLDAITSPKRLPQQRTVGSIKSCQC